MDFMYVEIKPSEITFSGYTSKTLTLSLPVRSTPNFSLNNTSKIRQLVIRKWELINERKLQEIKSKILSNLFNENYGLTLGVFNSTTGIKRANVVSKGSDMKSLFVNQLQIEIGNHFFFQ